MSRATAALLPASRETKWTVVDGAMTGTVRLMNATAFTIGRSPECEFVIVSDPKCSRKHAAVQWTDEGCEITSLNEENPVLVNGQASIRAVLKDGDQVKIGSTSVLFNLTSVPDDASIRHRQLSVVTSVMEPVSAQTAPSTTARSGSQAPTRSLVQNAPPPATFHSPYAQPARPRPAAPRRPTPPKKSNKMVIYVVVGLLGLFLFMSSSAKHKKELELRTEKQIQADIETANKLQEADMKQPNRHLDQSVTARQAQENFIRGFRDYEKGQFDRSLDSFQACLALDPAHTLCNRYIRLAQRRFNELVQYNIVLGRKYRDQNQFKSCRSAFRNVMVMMKDSNSAPYKEAKANYDACNALLEGRF